MPSVLYQTIKELQSLKGKAKQTFLENFRDTSTPEEVTTLKEYLKVVYGDSNWYQTKIEAGSSNSVMNIGKKKLSALEAINEFLSLPNRRGAAGASALSALAGRCHDDAERELVQYALWKDLKAGFAQKSINKVFPDLIFIPPYQRLSTLDKMNHLQWDWSQGIFVQTKEDFMFGNIICCEFKPEIRSRNYNLIEHENLPLQELARSIGEMLCERVVIHGEIYVEDENGVRLGREASNGLVNGVIQTGEVLPAGYNMKYVAWDLIPYGEFMSGKYHSEYETRHKNLVYVIESAQSVYPELAPFISLISTVRCKTLSEVRDAFSKVVNAHGEGIVLKNPKGVWEDNDAGHKDAVKVKVQIDSVELKIVSFNEADPKSKHAGTFASLQCETEDGLIQTGVSGMTDAMRLELHMNREKYIGSVVSARCNGIQYNPEAPHSLYFAQFVEVRPDKTSADTLERVEAIQRSAIESKIMSKEK